MRDCAQRSASVRAPGAIHPASWSRPVARPSLLGLIVAAIIGGTAAFSWSLSTWIAFDNAAPSDSAASTPEPTRMVEALPETVGHDE